MKQLFLLLIIVTQCSISLRASDGQIDDYFSERANLALRSVAHQMLALQGDSTTAIPPVRSTDDRRFAIRFPGELRYDTLRAVLEEQLAAAELPLRYDLAIYDCLEKTLLLGFSAQPENRLDGYACQDRSTLEGCVDISIRFPDERPAFTARAGWFGGLTVLFGLLLFGWRYHREPSPPASEQDAAKPERSPGRKLGRSIFYPDTQTIEIGNEEKKLTYREAKLLAYLSEAPNEVLPSERILAAVWGEEGVRVTRSLDVFISRLRKILKEEPRVEIASVHGVGYRLVVRSR